MRWAYPELPCKTMAIRRARQLAAVAAFRAERQRIRVVGLAVEVDVVGVAQSPKSC